MTAGYVGGLDGAEDETGEEGFFGVHYCCFCRGYGVSWRFEF